MLSRRLRTAGPASNWYTPWLQSTSYTPPPGFTQYRKVDSPTPIPFSSGSITLGAEPVLFEKKSCLHSMGEDSTAQAGCTNAPWNVAHFHGSVRYL
jgi:hypothetical protein